MCLLRNLFALRSALSIELVGNVPGSIPDVARPHVQCFQIIWVLTGFCLPQTLDLPPFLTAAWSCLRRGRLVRGGAAGHAAGTGTAPLAATASPRTWMMMYVDPDGAQGALPGNTPGASRAAVAAAAPTPTPTTTTTLMHRGARRPRTEEGARRWPWLLLLVAAKNPVQTQQHQFCG